MIENSEMDMTRLSKPEVAGFSFRIRTRLRIRGARHPWEVPFNEGRLMSIRPDIDWCESRRTFVSNGWHSGALRATRSVPPYFQALWHLPSTLQLFPGAGDQRASDWTR